LSEFRCAGARVHRNSLVAGNLLNGRENARIVGGAAGSGFRSGLGVRDGKRWRRRRGGFGQGHGRLRARGRRGLVRRAARTGWGAIMLRAITPGAIALGASTPAAIMPGASTPGAIALRAPGSGESSALPAEPRISPQGPSVPGILWKQDPQAAQHGHRQVGPPVAADRAVTGQGAEYGHIEYAIGCRFHAGNSFSRQRPLTALDASRPSSSISAE